MLPASLDLCLHARRVPRPHPRPRPPCHYRLSGASNGGFVSCRRGRRRLTDTQLIADYPQKGFYFQINQQQRSRRTGFDPTFLLWGRSTPSLVLRGVNTAGGGGYCTELNAALTSIQSYHMGQRRALTSEQFVTNFWSLIK